MAGAYKAPGKLDGLSGSAERTLLAELRKVEEELQRAQGARKNVLDRRRDAVVEPRVGDLVRAVAGQVVKLPHPRPSKGETVVVQVESQPVTVLAKSGTVNDQAELVVETLGALIFYSTGEEWWGSAAGGETGGGSGGVTPAEGDEPGFLSRAVYTNASSAFVGTTHLDVTVLAAVTFTTAADLPPGNWFYVVLYGPGAGGNGGCVAPSAANAVVGGSAGGAGARIEGWFSRQELIDSLPIAMTLPLGGAGGAGASAAANTKGARGSNPSGPALFGGLLAAYPGARAGLQASTTVKDGGGGGGGEETAGADGNNANAGAGGDPQGGAGSSTGNAPSLCGGGSGAGTSKGGNSRHGGSGGGSNGPAAVAALPGGDAQVGPTGGGGGGGVNAAHTVAVAGATGGGRLAPPSAGAAAGADGSACTVQRGGLGGGGGNAAVGLAPVTAQDGGNGGFGGGGGGGGGAAGSTDAGTNTGGDGGDGGDSVCIFEAYV